MVVHVVYWCSVPPVGLGWIRVVELLECAQHRCATVCHIRAVSVNDLKRVHVPGESDIAVLVTSQHSAHGIVLVSYCRGMVAGSHQAWKYRSDFCLHATCLPRVPLVLPSPTSRVMPHLHQDARQLVSDAGGRSCTSGLFVPPRLPSLLPENRYCRAC